MIYQFKTNINCSGCVAKITPYLNESEGIQHWEVDSKHPHKILRVETDSLTTDFVKAIVANAGYSAETIQQ